MYLTLLIIPIFGFIISGIIGRKIGNTGTQFITCFCIIISLIITIIAFYEVAICNSSVSINIISWIDCEIIDISWGLTFDSLTVSILLVIIIVSTLVHIFSIDYINNDPHIQRFFSYLSIFTFFIIVLITADNYLIIFVGWESIGISSYLLINFWFTRIQANKSAIKALLVNRVGDIFLSVSFFIIFFVFGNMDYITVFSIAPFINESIITIIGILLLLGAIGKSAQFGLHTWLADAIEGPTPVSALIHAATLVTAGVYLLIRSSPLIEYSSTTLIAITWIGAITAFFAASTGLIQNDIKRVIAYSTCSQIGYLFIACGLSAYDVSLFHLINHAFFKALLFLSAGSVLHATYDQQDQRKLGGLIAFLPFTYTTILIGSISLIAIPWITGFYSKDLILEIAYSQYEFSGYIAYCIGSISASITAFYSLRLISLTFITYPNASKITYHHSHDASGIVIIPLIILSIIAIFFGYLARDIYVGIGSDFLNNSIFIHPSHNNIIEAEFSISIINKIIPIILTIIGFIFAIYIYHFIPNFIILITNNKIGRTFYKFFNGKYYIDIIYNYFIINKTIFIGYNISKIIDRGLIEIIGPYGISTFIIYNSNNISKIDTGNITNYALYITISIIIFSFILFYPIIINSNININTSNYIDIRIIIIILIAIITNSKKLLFIPSPLCYL